MKLVIITDAWHPQINGVVRTYEHLTKRLESKGHSVKIISPADFNHKTSMPGYSEIDLVFFPYRRLRKMIEEASPDTIHIAVEGPLGWAARKYCVQKGYPFTTSYHTQFPDYFAKRTAKFFPFLYKSAYKTGIRYVKSFHKHSTSVLVATLSLEKTLKDWGLTSPMHHFSRGIDLETFHSGPKTLFNDLKGPIALYVGRIAIEKNIEAFLEMPWPGTKVIVGDGPSRAPLQTQYNNVLFVGKKTGKDLADHYRSADVFVFPSKTDTFGIVLIEALACGLPVAAYNVTGPKDIVTQPYLGSLTKSELGKAALKAIKIGTKKDREKHIKDHYTWEKATEQFTEAMIHARKS